MSAAESIFSKFTLQRLREREGIQQKQVASKLGIGQPGVSRIETQENPKLATVDSYIAALGGEMNITASFRRPDGTTETVFVRMENDPQRFVNLGQRWRPPTSARPTREAREARLAALREEA